MLNYLRSKLLNILKVKKFNTDNAADVAAIDGYADEITDMDSGLAVILAAEDIQTHNTKGITEDTVDAKKTMAETVIQVAHKAIPKARKAKNKEITKQLKHEVTFIYRAANADALSRARDIRKVLSDNAGVGKLFPNVKPADITAMDDSIKAFDIAQLNPPAARETKKIEGTTSLIEAFKTTEAAMENMYDYFYGEYKLTKPLLVKELRDCMAVEAEGIRHNGILALVAEANPIPGALTNAIQDAEMKILELNLIATTNVYGLCGISKIVSGTYHVEFTKVGYVTKQMIIFVKRGHIEQVEVLMERVPV